ncbi:MAG: response regulator [Planctomycetota bacterium]|jgi:DNA-binding NarL/FixJ family response regulator
MSIRVLLADDHVIVREGFRALIENEPDMEVIAQADDGLKAVEAARDHVPDVVVMDVAMPNLNGIEATRQIVAQFPSVRVVALSVHSDRRYVSQMLRAGSMAYLLKNCAPGELVAAIRSVVSGQTYLASDLVDMVVESYLRGDKPAEPAPVAVLTPREREILQLVAESKTAKEIAAMLHISVRTVDAHRQNIMKKLSVNSIAGLTKYAVREGLTSLND